MWTITKLDSRRNNIAIPRGSVRPGPSALRYLPNDTSSFGRWRLVENESNDYMIDREYQRSGESYSGIRGIRQQDAAVTGSMGTIYNRSQEHLGTTDTMIIRCRRRFINAAKAFRDQGIVPPGVDSPAVYHLRSGQVIIPRDVEWWEGTKDLRERFTAKPSIEATPIATS
jgi:phthalate 4,5-dioxygenase oxygenase subunit